MIPVSVSLQVGDVSQSPRIPLCQMWASKVLGVVGEAQQAVQTAVRWQASLHRVHGHMATGTLGSPTAAHRP